ncbi:MAG: hypothetical protein H6595_01825 [Flavobacteriales bacterium]|nr:hypothetical protein [Flavobacteriales bacterium]MCB9166200.1 hypothetical protein [Flavobacteriales bacterium]
MRVVRGLLRKGTLLLALLALGHTPVHAQKTAPHDLLVQFAGLNAEKEKFVYEALLAFDPDMLLSISIPLQRAKVRTVAAIDRNELEAQLAPQGIHVVHVDGPTGAGPEGRSAPAGAQGFPQYIDTGHPEQDADNYATAKAAWIDAHPEAYQQLQPALNTPAGNSQ